MLLNKSISTHIYITDNISYECIWNIEHLKDGIHFCRFFFIYHELFSFKIMLRFPW